jgi:hypothetical protein
MKKKISIKSASDIRLHQHQQIPEKISEQLDAWISGEKKNETKNTEEVIVPKNAVSSIYSQIFTEKNVRLNINLPEKVHHSLKVACLEKNMTITNFIKQLIESELRKM